MGRFLGIRELFPRYPLQLVTPPGSKIRLGTRDLYVDVPFLVYRLYILQWEYHEGRRNREEALELIEKAKNRLKEELGDYANMYRVMGPIEVEGVKPYMKLVIRWDRLLEYLEYKAETTIEKAKHIADRSKAINTIREYYIENIIHDYVKLLLISGQNTAMKLLAEPLTKSENERENYKKLLVRLGEIDEVEWLVSRLEKALKKLAESWMEKLVSHLPEEAGTALSLALSNALMSIKGIRRAIEENASIHEGYLYIRRSMEGFVRLLNFYKYINNKNYISNPLKEASKILYEENVSVKNLQSLYPIYAIVSEIIHKITEPPFYSILEFKLFKHILEWYVKELEAMAGVNNPRETGGRDPWNTLACEQKAIENAVSIARSHHSRVVELIRSLVDNLPGVEKEALEILAKLKISQKTLRRGLVTEKDYNESINRAATLLKGYGGLTLTLALYALNNVKEELARALQNKGIIRRGDEEYAEKTAFYLLLLTLENAIETPIQKP